MSDFEAHNVDQAVPPRRARVEDAQETSAETVGRKRDYLEGFLQQKPEGDAPHAPGGALYEAVIDALKEIYDPEIPVNIYELGLIYGVEVTEDGAAVVNMTLTTPNCPVAESMPTEVELRVAAVPGIAYADVNLVWDPPWDPAKMTDEARLELGIAVGVDQSDTLIEFKEGSGMTTITRERPKALILTAAAETRIADLMGKAPTDAIGVKLSTPRRGCSGLAYSVDYVAAAQPFDERIDTPGGTLFVDGGSILYLIGSTMDWVEDDFTAGFVFVNPNAKGSCGCGESFTV